MSVSAPTAAPPAPGPSPATGAAGAHSGAVGGNGGDDGPPGFDAMLAAATDSQGTQDAANAKSGAQSKAIGKAAANAKAADDDGKAKAADDATDAGAATAAAATDAAATVADQNANPGLLPPPPVAIQIVATPPKTGEAVSQAAAAAAQDADKTAGQVAAAVLAQLGAPGKGASDPGKAEPAAGQPGAAQAASGAPAAAQSAAVQAALAAGTAASDAAATAKAAAPVTPQTPAPPTVVAVQAPAAVAEAVTAPPPATPVPTATPLPADGAKPEPVAATGAKDKTQAAKAARVDGAPAQATPNTDLSTRAANALQPVTGMPAKGEGDTASPQAAMAEAKAAPADGPQTPGGLDTTSTTTPATLIHAAAVAVRGAPQTVANLAAQIAKKLDARSTRFDLQLDPAGLGRVNVRVEIGGDGRMSAAMAFDNPQAAAELKSRASELQRALEQSGFDLSGGLSFDVAGDSGQGRQAQGQDPDTNTGAAFRGRAFQAALDTTADAAPDSQLMYRRSSVSGVDIRI